MTKFIIWEGFGTREAYGFTWTSGQCHRIDDDIQALDLLTQPNDGFREAEAGEVPADPKPASPPKEKEDGDKRQRKNPVRTASGDDGDESDRPPGRSDDSTD